MDEEDCRLGRSWTKGPRALTTRQTKKTNQAQGEPNAKSDLENQELYVIKSHQLFKVTYLLTLTLLFLLKESIKCTPSMPINQHCWKIELDRTKLDTDIKYL